MPVEVTTALSVASAVGGFFTDRKAKKKQQALQRKAVEQERKAQEKQDKINEVRNLAERRAIFQKQRIAIAQNISQAAQGAGGLEGSSLAAANSAITSTGNAQIGRINTTEALGIERNALTQSAADLRGKASQVSNPSGFLFTIAQNLAPSGEQLQDMFTNNSLFRP